MSDPAPTTPPLKLRLACPGCRATIEVPATLDLSTVTIAAARPVSDGEQDRREVYRRAGALAMRCEKDGRWRFCGLCGKRIYFNAIHNHYQRSHRDELMAMPAEVFE